MADTSALCAPDAVSMPVERLGSRRDSAMGNRRVSEPSFTVKSYGGRYSIRAEPRVPRWRWIFTPRKAHALRRRIQEARDRMVLLESMEDFYGVIRDPEAPPPTYKDGTYVDEDGMRRGWS